MKEQKCKHSKKCSGCQMSNLDYLKQLEYKQNKTSRIFQNICQTNQIIPSPDVTRYRNKAQFSFKQTGKEIVCGIYQSAEKKVTPIDDCIICREDDVAIAHTVAKLLKSFKLKPYDFRTNEGLFKSIIIRTACATGEKSVTLFTTQKDFKQKQKFVNALLSRHEEIKTVVLNVSESDKLVFGDDEESLFGDGSITDILLEKKFSVSASSFYQINKKATELLYQKAIEFADIKDGDIVFDAYCGTGTIGICASDNASEVIGVELNASAVERAKENAALNNITNAHFFCDDAGKFMLKMQKENKKIDVLFMDPPRSGSDKKFLSAISKIKPQTIVYISCCIETQRRDIDNLIKNGYTVEQIQPFDMFPMTKHIENIILLKKAR